MKVYLAQLKCPQNHCVCALAGEFESDEDANKLGPGVLGMFETLIESHVLNRECGICHSTDLHVHIDRTRFQTMEEARPALKQMEEAQAATAAFLRSMKN